MKRFRNGNIVNTHLHHDLSVRALHMMLHLWDIRWDLCPYVLSCMKNAKSQGKLANLGAKDIAGRYELGLNLLWLTAYVHAPMLSAF